MLLKALKKKLRVSKHRQNRWGTTDTSLQFMFADTHAQGTTFKVCTSQVTDLHIPCCDWLHGEPATWHVSLTDKISFKSQQKAAKKTANPQWGKLGKRKYALCYWNQMGYFQMYYKCCFQWILFCLLSNMQPRGSLKEQVIIPWKEKLIVQTLEGPSFWYRCLLGTVSITVACNERVIKEAILI